MMDSRAELTSKTTSILQLCSFRLIASTVQGLRLPDVSFPKVVNQPEPIIRRFLYADPTPNALQVFSKYATRSVDTTDLPVEHGAEDGVWISADPIRGCIVCNIGESKWCFENFSMAWIDMGLP